MVIPYTAAQLGYIVGFIDFVVVSGKALKMNCLGLISSLNRHRRRIGDSAATNIGVGRKGFSKGTVHPFDNAFLRAEVRAQCQGRTLHWPNWMALGIEKQSNIGVAKTVQGLHGIANQK